MSVAGVVWSPLRTRVFLSSSRRGVRDINKMSRSLLDGADGVVIQFRNKFVLGSLSPITGCALSRLHSLRSSPSARAEDASRLFLIAQPPLLGAEGKSHRPPQLSCVTYLIRPASLSQGMSRVILDSSGHRPRLRQTGKHRRC